MTEHIQPYRRDWYSLGYSFGFMMKNGRVLLMSILLILAMIGLTALSYTLIVDKVEGYLTSLVSIPEQVPGIVGWLKHAGWTVISWFSHVVVKIIAFYLSFLLSYTLTSPGYGFLSVAAEKLHLGEQFQQDGGFSLSGVLVDMFEAFKISLFGLLVSAAAVLMNFIPVIGQMMLILFYVSYSALMFIDFPASRRRWTLGHKLGWLRRNTQPAFRLGILPALVSMIPLVNIFCMSFLFPVLTVQATLNFAVIESERENLHS